MRVGAHDGYIPRSLSCYDVLTFYHLLYYRHTIWKLLGLRTCYDNISSFILWNFSWIFTSLCDIWDIFYGNCYDRRNSTLMNCSRKCTYTHRLYKSADTWMKNSWICGNRRIKKAVYTSDAYFYRSCCRVIYYYEWSSMEWTCMVNYLVTECFCCPDALSDTSILL